MFQTAPAESGPAASVTTPRSDPKLGERLPKPAREKLAHLRAARDEARALLDAALDKVQALREPGAPLATALFDLERLKHDDQRGLLLRAETKKLGQAEATVRDAERLAEAEAEVSRERALVEAADSERRRRSVVWIEATRLVTAVEEWIKSRTRPIKAATLAPLGLPPDKSAEEEVFHQRDLINALRAERKRVEEAVMPVREAKNRARKWVEGQAAKVEARGLARRDGSTFIKLPEANSAVALACWLNPDAVTQRLEREIDALGGGDRMALSELEQAKRLRELDDKLLEAGRREEALINRAAMSGIVVRRRGNADPRAVLGVDG